MNNKDALDSHETIKLRRYIEVLGDITLTSLNQSGIVQVRYTLEAMFVYDD